MFKRKKKSPSAKDINALTKKSENTNLSSQSYSSLPKSMYSGNEKVSLYQSQPTRSTSALGTKTLNLSNSSSSQDIGSGGNSPLDLPMETLQSISAAYNLGRGYTSDSGNSLSNAPHTKSQNRSPFQSPVHSTYSSSNSSSSKTATRHRSLEKGEFSGLFSGDSTLERQFERLQMMMPTASDRISDHGEINSSSTLPVSRGERRNASMSYSRDRSQEREGQYPHMGARSLERSTDRSDHYFSIGNRSRSSDRQDFTSQLQQTQEQFRNLSRDSLILELQSQITDLNKDCAKLQQELDSTKDKLSSTMNSIKTFWSPELKKERSLRKEESAKYSLLNEQYKATQAEVKKQSHNLRDLETQLRVRQTSIVSSVSTEEHENLKRGLTDQTKEVKILRKTVDEMDIRLDTQKQTLAARDESIKKLLEMLHSKGLAIDKIEESQKELEANRLQSAEDAKKILGLQKNVDEKEKEINQLQESHSKLNDEFEHARLQLQQQPASTHTLQAIMEAKDSRISALEKELQSLEDKLHRLGEDGGLPDKDGSLKERGTTSREKALKSEIESLKNDLTNRDTDLAGQRLKVDTLTTRQTEHQHYINVLKDQIRSKEEQSAMFQADIDDLRERLREKDSAIERKAGQAQGLNVDKRKLELECAELKDNIEIKERKINVLQRKVENLEQLLQEKEDQLLQAKTLSTTASQSSKTALEEALSDKDKQIDRLKEQRDLIELEHQQECEHLTSTNQHLKAELDTIQLDVTDKQTELCELREEVSELKSSRYKAETRLRQLELSICEKDSEISKANREIEELKEMCTVVRSDNMTEGQLSDLSRQVEQCQTEMKSAQTEVDRLLDILKECELEKQEKDYRIKEMTDNLKEYKQKFGTLKRHQQADRKKNANLLEEARRREEDVTSDATQLKGSMKEKEGRIEELEEALRESVKITAEREMLLMEQKMQIDAFQSKIEELQSDQLKSTNSAKEYSTKLASFVKQLEEKDNKLKKMNSERHKHLEEVFEMKQEALQAALCEKDANIALLEMTSTKKQRNVEEIDKLSKEKEKLNQQLKELAQNRTKYLSEREKTRSLKKDRTKSKHSVPTSKETSPQDDPTPAPAPVTEKEQSKKNDET